MGKLIIGDNYQDMKSWWGQYISKKDKWLAGVLTYNQDERNIYFFNGKLMGEETILVFNIDTTHFEFVRRGSFRYYYLVYIKDKDNNEYLFTSDISFYERSQSADVYRQGKQIAYNKSLVNIINFLKSNK